MIIHPDYKFIAIEGNIGAGKTTLARRLAAESQALLILEQFTDNPFLPLFYENPERYAFPVELFFMSERHKQLQEHFSAPTLFNDLTISDYFFYKTILFARQNLLLEEFRLFQRLFHTLNNYFPKPDIILYLHRSIEKLQANIARRGRKFETTISDNYLHTIEKAYFDYFKTESEIPIVIVDANELDFIEKEKDYDTLKKLLNKQHPPGISYL